MKQARIAAIDVGSDTIHMIVVRRRGKHRFEHLLQRSRLLKLGLLEQRKGGLPDYARGAIHRTLEAFVRQARDAGASTILIGATAALRQDPQRHAITQKLGRELGVPVRIVSRRREIALGFLAARPSLRPSGRQLFVDSGGGSTEVTVCEGRRAAHTVSLPVGASMLSALLEGDPPGLLSFARLMVPIQAAMQKAPVASKVRGALFSGGTSHHICAVAGMPRHMITRPALERALRHLLRKPARKIARKYDMEAQRVPLLICGALILAALLDHYGLDRSGVTLNTMREGMIEAWLRSPGNWWKG